MKLTHAQRTASKEPGHLLLEACPGSGKTRTLVAKLLRCIDELGGSVRRVACITYTNAAVHEIEQRLRLYASEDDEQKVEVATIHSFCVRNVLGPFHWRIPEFRKGFTVAAPDGEVFQRLAADIADTYRLDQRSARESLESASRRADGTAVVRPPTPPEAVIEFWNALARDGYIDFTNIVYQSYLLLAQNPSLLSSLQARYSWILVDEFQDTTSLQVELLKLVASGKRTNFFLVGDTRQSIFGFAGSEPLLMDQFGDSISAVRGPALSDNFRSSRAVIDDAERLLPGPAPMRACGESAEYPASTVYRHCDNRFTAITEHFLPALEQHGISFGDAAILAATWFSLYPLAGDLRELGIPVVGPGARPYRRKHFYASLAEQICAQVENPAPERIRQVERELFFLLTDMTGEGPNEVFSFSGRLLIHRLIRLAGEYREAHREAVPWLTSSVHGVGAALVERGWLDRKQLGDLVASVDAMVADIGKNGLDAARLLVSDLGMFADPQTSLRLMTLHRAKGREFDAVAIIDAHDGLLPHSSARTAEQVDEGRRLLYVGITRARKLLYYFTSEEDWRPPSRFLGLGELSLLNEERHL